MIEGSEKRKRQLAFELQNSHVCEKRSNAWCCLRKGKHIICPYPLAKVLRKIYSDFFCQKLLSECLVIISIKLLVKGFQYLPYRKLPLCKSIT